MATPRDWSSPLGASQSNVGAAHSLGQNVLPLPNPVAPLFASYQCRASKALVARQKTTVDPF